MQVCRSPCQQLTQMLPGTAPGSCDTHLIICLATCPSHTDRHSNSPWACPHKAPAAEFLCYTQGLEMMAQHFFKGLSVCCRNFPSVAGTQDTELIEQVLFCCERSHPVKSALCDSLAQICPTAFLPAWPNIFYPGSLQALLAESSQSKVAPSRCSFSPMAGTQDSSDPVGSEGLPQEWWHWLHWAL